MSEFISPATHGLYRNLNPKVLAGLRLGQNVWDNRATGKTITMLTFIAVTQPVSRLFTKGPIIVTQTVRDSEHIKAYWRACFPNHDAPRFMTISQNWDGLSGVVFTDECNLGTLYSRCVNNHYLVYGGGVYS